MKKIISIIMVAALMLSLAACNTDNLAEYKKAFDKTDQISKGQVSGEFSTIMDINTDNLTPEEIKDLNYVKDMNGNFSAVYDDSLEKGIYRNYISMGGLGFDFDVYLNGDKIFMKIPVAGKYLDLTELISSAEVAQINEEAFDKPIISEETMKHISQKWVGLMNEEDVFKGKDIILTTPDGEVKTKEYTITLSSDQIRTLANESLDAFSKDESLRSFYNEYMASMNENEATKSLKSFDEAIKTLRDSIENYDVESFKYTALVDIDGYIVNEIVTVSLKSTEESNIIKGVSFDLNIKNWDINKEQVFDFPELTEDNTINADDMKDMEEMPDLMESIFSNKN